MFDRFAGEFHSRLCREDKSVAQRFRPRQTFARFFGSVFGGDGLPGAEGDYTDVPFPFFLRAEAGESSNGVFADDGGGCVWMTLSQKSLLRCRTRGQRGMPQLKCGTTPASLIRASIWPK